MKKKKKRFPRRKKWQHTPVFLPAKFHGQSSLVGYHGTSESWTHQETKHSMYDGILLSHKKEHISVSSNEVNEPIIQSEVSQKEKNKYQI